MRRETNKGVIPFNQMKNINQLTVTNQNQIKVPLLSKVRNLVNIIENNIEEIDGNHIFWDAFLEVKKCVKIIDSQKEVF